MTLTEPSRNGPIRSVCVMSCFSPDGRTVHAEPRHTPSMYASGAIASRCAAIKGGGWARSWGEGAAAMRTSETAAILDMAASSHPIAGAGDAEDPPHHTAHAFAGGAHRYASANPG